MTGGFWQGRRVFVTGHTGFMGGWLSACLLRAGAQVTGYALAPPTTPSFCAATGLEQRIARSVRGDVRDLAALRDAMTKADPEIVFHLAAQPLVLAAHAAPVETFQINVMGTVNLLQAAIDCDSLRALVMITTDKVYHNRHWHHPYRETDRLGGREPYSASKAASELVIDAYRASYLADRGVAAIRAGNIIGGGDWAANRLVPDAIAAFRQGAPLTLRHPGATRPWQHVLDPLAGYLTLAERLYGDGPAYSGGWNFGPTQRDCRPVGALAALLAENWSAKAQVVTDGDGSVFEETFLSLDSAQARARLGWEPRWPLEQGVKALTAWYRAFHDGADMWTVTQNQIAAFDTAEGTA